jgi:hypothetical protein
VLHQVGVSFDLYCDARKHKITILIFFFLEIRAERRQKSISVEFSLTFSHRASHIYTYIYIYIYRTVVQQLDRGSFLYIYSTNIFNYLFRLSLAIFVYSSTKCRVFPNVTLLGS